MWQIRTQKVCQAIRSDEAGFLEPNPHFIRPAPRGAFTRPVLAGPFPDAEIGEESQTMISRVLTAGGLVDSRLRGSDSRH